MKIMSQRLIGLNKSVTIAAKRNPEYWSILHLAVQSILCTRPLIVLIKDLIADANCVNWKDRDLLTTQIAGKFRDGILYIEFISVQFKGRTSLWKDSNDKTPYDLLKENNSLLATGDKDKTLSQASIETLSSLFKVIDIQ